MRDRRTRKQELSYFLYRNFYNEKENCIDLSDLDFRVFNCNVAVDNMQVKGSLTQSNQSVTCDLYQQDQNVRGDLYQDHQNVKGLLIQNKQRVGSDLRQGYQYVKGNIYD